jgi:biopolymer transport protein TolR
MAMDVGGAKGGVKSDINVTPLVDVMLVLLIIMMLVAPLLQQGVPLTLPTAVNSSDKPDTADQTVVFVDAHSKLYVNQIEIPEDQLVAKLQSIFEDKGGEKVVYLKGDVDAPYGAIMKMMDALRKAQIDTVGLITERPGGTLAEKGGE